MSKTVDSCENCDHWENQEGSHCYMFRNKPHKEDICGLHQSYTIDVDALVANNVSLSSPAGVLGLSASDRSVSLFAATFNGSSRVAVSIKSSASFDLDRELSSLRSRK